jgi:predicted RNA polymerase sigma factor
MFSHDRRVLALALGGGAPAVVLAVLFLWKEPWPPAFRVTAALVVIALWLGLALALRRHVVRPLQTVSNLLAALREGDAGFYALQAAIAGCHARAEDPQSVDWGEIAGIYAVLLARYPSPVVALNQAAAIGMAQGPERGLSLLAELERTGQLVGYHLFAAAKADLLRRLGRRTEAAVAYRDALGSVTSPVERRYLERRLAEASR